MIQKILIANRGEIAVRILRTCRQLGIACVAVYSTADANALHVLLADESVCIGPARAADSYLNMNNLIQAALSTGCDAIHPGFGFLSENAMFARLVSACGLVFIGPDWQIIEAMGDKHQARVTMCQAGLPLIEGSGLIETLDQGAQEALRIGYPIMAKAASGGGGKGMRIIRTPEEFESLFAQAQAEAKACFGNDAMYLEKYLERPKHVEIQIAGDHQGHLIHLAERDCSFQLAQQKMLEEAPCPVLDERTRQVLCRDALKAAAAVGYDSLGTVEFLLDAGGQHYFMEMNTRIQVEHPITEMITGLDLIALQIAIADGQPLPVKQQDIQPKGWALECRINAQDAQNGLRPDAGSISFLNMPGGRGIRVDSAIYSGCQISPFYDANLCKVIAYGDSRQECIGSMCQALKEFMAEGVATNEDFLYYVLHQDEFINGSYSTSFAADQLEEWNARQSI